MKLFLDDVRIPTDCINYMYHRIGALNLIYLEKWVIVKNYEEFIEQIKNNYNDITHISFDHDLADSHYGLDFEVWKDHSSEQLGLEFTGTDCAEFTKKFYLEKNLKLPIMFVHSMNPVGTQNIIKVFK